MSDLEVRDLVAQLGSTDEDERYAACLKLEAAESLTDAAVDALIVALGDSGHGVEMVSDHNGGGQYDPVDIASVAHRALVARGGPHCDRLVTSLATAHKRYRLLASVVATVVTADHALRLRRDASLELRRALLWRFTRELESLRYVARPNEPIQIAPEELDRVRPFARAILDARNDADRDLAAHARGVVAGDRTFIRCPREVVQRTFALVETTS